ncbi:MAG: hypothetical protein HGN29_08395 [Asgard group archaeon]|nr:hypothetical protein [Asgard group archaeon]
MKALIIYFTSLGRSKKTSAVIGSAMTNYDVDYFPFILTGTFGMKVSIQNQHTKGDFSTIEQELSELDKIKQDYDLIIFGMPTYGDYPPSAFYEIVKRVDIKEQKVAIFTTCSITGKKTLELMEKTVKEAGAIIIAQARFKGFFRPKLKQAFKFGQSINEALAKEN